MNKVVRNYLLNNLNEHFDYKNESFDVVHCNQVIEHLCPIF